MLRIVCRVFLVSVLLTGLSNAQETVFVGDVPLPEDAVSAQQPEAPFLGTWVGKFDNRKNHIMIVESLGRDGLADVIYAVGNDPKNRGRWFRRKAMIEGDTLVFADDGFPARYSLSPTGRMRGVFADNKSFAILERRELAALLASPADDWFSIGELEFLQTDLVEGGSNIRLAVVVYRPKGEGPFPLAIVHHGSTGRGTNPNDFGRVWTYDWFADVLNADGWLVAYPQRRGRGGSDGLYDEGFAEDRSLGYSPEPALSLPGADRALEDANAAFSALRQRPEVDSGKALLAGMSRGGVVAVMQAGHAPQEFAGVINFVGGWVNEKYGDPSINPTLFRRIGSFDGPVLSIYGKQDSHYSIEHSSANLAEMEALGVDNQLHVVRVPGYGNGHWALYLPNLWEEVVAEFLGKIDWRVLPQ
jgi:dienelactone hydrolase